MRFTANVVSHKIEYSQESRLDEVTISRDSGGQFDPGLVQALAQEMMKFMKSKPSTEYQNDALCTLLPILQA